MSRHPVSTTTDHESSIVVYLADLDESRQLLPSLLQYQSQLAEEPSHVSFFWVPKPWEFDYWQRQMTLASQGLQSAVNNAAAFIWDRAFGQRQHFFKRIEIKSFRKRKDVLFGDDALDRCALDGKALLQGTRTSVPELISRFHFNFTELPSSDEMLRAGALFHEVANEIVQIEQRYLAEKFEPNAELTTDENNIAKKYIRERLKKVQTRLKKEGIALSTFNLEARLRYIEAGSEFYASISDQIRPHITPLGQRIFDFLHICGERTRDGTALAVPVVFSPGLRSLLEYTGGLYMNQKGFHHLILSDLIAILDGADPTKDPLMESAHIAAGMCYSYPIWAITKRQTEKENRRIQRLEDSH